MTTDRRTFLKAGAALAAGGTAKLAHSEDTLKARADDVLQRAADAGDVPGVVAVATDRQGDIYEGGFGRRMMGQQTPMTADTVFWIASMTKAITGTAAMQLVEQGKVNLDSPASHWVPDLARAQVLDGWDADGQPRLRAPKRAITLRHLLTHTAGFTYDIWSEPMLRYEKATGTPFIGTCQTAALNAPLMFDPGDRWEYGINIDWAGRAVEKVSGQSLEVYFREHIFEPLGMTDTGFLIGSKQKARTARLYQKTESGALEAAPEGPLMPQSPEFFMGGGGLFSTAPNYMAFLQMLLNDGTFNEAQVLKPETGAMIRQNQMGDLKATTLKT